MLWTSKQGVLEMQIDGQWGVGKLFEYSRLNDG